MKALLKQLLAPLASLKLTVVLIVLAMILIYAGTWAQIDAGIWQVQKQFFHSLFTWIPFQIFFPRPKPGEMRIPGGFPMLGGYTIGALLLLNLIAAHSVRFKLSAKRIGIILIHFGLILLLVGEGLTSAFQVESQMSVEVGSSSNFSQDIRTAELAIIDTTPSDHDDVAAIPASMLKTGETIHHSALPVNVHVERYFPNADILGPNQAGSRRDARATAGMGVGITALEAPQATGTNSQIDFPAAYVTLTADQNNLGTYLVSAQVDPARRPLFPPQEFQVHGKTYQVALRFKRLYKPYTIHLEDFRFDRYPGTNVPKDFSSFIRLVDPARNVDRQVRIWMNNPLRYNGETFFQADWNHETERGTVLQIVRNPGWTMPYIACAIGGLGLLVHFGIGLISFLRRSLDLRASGPAWSSPPTVIALAGVAVIFLLTAGIMLRPVGPRTDFDLNAFSKLPVSFEGRIQPLDTIARTTLKVVSNGETASVDNTRMPAIRWLVDMWAQPEKAADYRVIRIDHSDVIGLLGLDPQQRRYSFNQIAASKDKFQEQFNRAVKTPAAQRDMFQRKLLELAEKIEAFNGLQHFERLLVVPPLEKGESWRPLVGAVQNGKPHPGAQAYVEILEAYHGQKPDEFNAAVASYGQLLDQRIPVERANVKFEALFHRIDPFTQCILVYVTAFVLACLSWVFWGVPLRRGAMFALALALAVHTAGLIARIHISGRPPVTNLASSAIFIAWGAVVLAIGLEIVFRNGIGAACAGMLGFLSLLIADRLALSGDTLKVLQAVLDTNFWLATHVVMITLGYAATFLAGFLGIVYVFLYVIKALDRDSSKELARMIYGIVCFAVLFSFIGTILGGIWADQSWGRFWGWDPKENGAVLIVLCNALLLHARWGGLVKDRGIACLAIFGNIVTSWSWFGTNMLGVGLHSYGFMDSALMWLLAFVVSQLALIGLANVPLAWLRSSSAAETTGDRARKAASVGV